MPQKAVVLARPMLQKPYRLHELTDMVAALLDVQGPAATVTTAAVT
jgi:hypothetical protein